jgi:class 3 adenylate cyclase
MTMPASPWLQTVDGTVDVKILLEEALAAAVLTGVPPATRVVTTALSVSHFRPGTLESESFVARARVLNTGSTFTTAEVLVEDALGRAVVHATGSFVLRPIDPPPPPPKALLPVDEPTYPTPDHHSRPLPTEDFTWWGVPPLEAFRKVIRGEMPGAPVWQLLGARGVDAAEGSGAWVLEASPWLSSRSNELAPGVLTSMLHHALGGAPFLLATGDQYVGIVGQSLTFLRSVALDGREILIRSNLVHRGRELLVSTAEALDAEGNQVALGSQTSVLVERRRKAAPARAQRLVTTVLFTDIVSSTKRAEELGDGPWRELLAEHDAVVRRQLQLFKGREIKTTGDGFLATFDSPTQAVQCARAARDGVRRLGLEIRVGVHTGECELAGGDVAGVAVHVASRVQSLADPSEILVSSTVRDLTSGSGLQLSDRGVHSLKGLEGEWQLFAVEG